MTDREYLWIGAAIVRDEFERQPPHVQAETRARVQRLLRDELARNQTQPSALMRLAHIYGLGLPRERTQPVKRMKHGRRWDG